MKAGCSTWVIAHRRPRKCVEQDQRARGIEEWIVEARLRPEAEPAAHDGSLGAALRGRHPIDRAPVEVRPERVRRLRIGGEQRLDRSEIIRRRDRRRARGIVREPVDLRDGPDLGDEQAPPGLLHHDARGLGGAPAAQRLDAQLGGLEGAGFQELAAEARRAREAALEPGGPQRDRRDVAAVGSPDLPIGRQVRGVAAVAARQPCVVVEITHRFAAGGVRAGRPGRMAGCVRIRFSRSAAWAAPEYATRCRREPPARRARHPAAWRPARACSRRRAR